MEIFAHERVSVFGTKWVLGIADDKKSESIFHKILIFYNIMQRSAFIKHLSKQKESKYETSYIIILCNYTMLFFILQREKKKLLLNLLQTMKQASSSLVCY